MDSDTAVSVAGFQVALSSSAKGALPRKKSESKIRGMKRKKKSLIVCKYVLYPFSSIFSQAWTRPACLRPPSADVAHNILFSTFALVSQQRHPKHSLFQSPYCRRSVCKAVRNAKSYKDPRGYVLPCILYLTPHENDLQQPKVSSIRIHDLTCVFIDLSVSDHQLRCISIVSRLNQESSIPSQTIRRLCISNLARTFFPYLQF